MIWRNLAQNKKLLNDAARSGAFIIFDTETTGLGKGAEIIEFAAYKCRFKGNEFQPYDELHLFIKPSSPVPAKVTEINHITNEFLADKPDEQSVFPKIKEFLGDAPVLGAYNSGFDIRMLNGLYERCGSHLAVGTEVDLLKIAKDIFCETKLPNHKLATIAETYGVDEGVVFHDARQDTLVLIKVLNCMVDDIRKNGTEKKLLPVTVYKLNYYPGYRGNSRIYAVTSSGMLYYDLKGDRWASGTGTIDISELDMASVEEQVFRLSGCSDYKSMWKKYAAENSAGLQKRAEEAAKHVV